MFFVHLYVQECLKVQQKVQVKFLDSFHEPTHFQQKNQMVGQAEQWIMPKGQYLSYSLPLQVRYYFE
jgi:hypothetical protein